MSKVLALGVLIVVGLLIAAVVFSALVYSNQETTTSRQASIRKQRTIVTKMVESWRIEPTEDVNRIASASRNLILNSLMSLKNKSSTARKDITASIEEGWDIRRWIAFPASGDNIYNPTVLAGDMVIARRDADVLDIWGCKVSYASTPDPRVRMGQYSEVMFVDKGDNRIVTAECRRNSSREMPVFEDLRTVVGGDGTVVTGVALIGDGRTLTSVFKTVPPDPKDNGGGVVLKELARLPSPVGAKTEKNWLFVERGGVGGAYDVLYDIEDNVGVVAYQYTLGSKRLSTDRTVHPFSLPMCWSRKFRSSTTPLRMSAICPLPEGDGYALLLHTKDMNSLFYYYFMLILDNELRPVAYIPNNLFGDVAVRIFFVMNMEIRGDELHAVAGVSDEIPGIAVYDWSVVSSTAVRY